MPQGGAIFVGGMWTGDFVGTVVRIGFTEAEFRVDRPLGDRRRLEVPAPGTRVVLAYSKRMELRLPTDEERQVTISEEVGDIEIA